jgi:hypothetical protein
MSGYPDFERFAYGFGRAELNLGGAGIVTAITNVSFDQPTTEGAVMGTRPYPLMRTEGNMGLGEGTITFSDESERLRFLKALGNNYRQKAWPLNWTLTAHGQPTVHMECVGCRVLGNPVAHQQGDDALGGDVTFSFMYYTIDGLVPHQGLPSPTR